MPAVNQDFIIYDLDEFQVRFNVTDAQSTLTGTDSRAWWGVALSATAEEPLIERSNETWEAPGEPFENVDFGGGNLLVITSTYIDVLIQLRAPSSVTTGIGGSINISPAAYPTTYYHECIFSGEDNQQDSVGIATGEITVYQSLFTQQNYRK